MINLNKNKITVSQAELKVLAKILPNMTIKDFIAIQKGVK